MSTIPSFASEWSPGLIGLTVASALYGVGLGQFVVYVRAFPHDGILLRALVYFVFALENAQTYCLILTYHHLLISCRMTVSPDCAVELPSKLIFSIFAVYLITFIVQSFYAHRVWIISGQNRIITSIVVLTASSQMVFGLLCVIGLIHMPTFEVLFTIEYSPIAAVASAICDAVITFSIVYYLRPARIGMHRRSNYIKKLNTVFMEMGLLSFLNALAVAIMYYIQDKSGEAQFLTAAPGILLSKTYTNSMLSVLNARKSIREEQEAIALRTIEIPTIPTIR